MANLLIFTVLIWTAGLTEGNGYTDMCDETVIENTNRIFLSTPNYPSPPTFTNISPCRCSIRGSNITSIEIVELVLHTSDNGTKSRLEINYGDVTYRTESLNGTARRLVFNKRLTSTSTTAEIILNHNNINIQYVWIEIQGVSMKVTCNNGTESSSSPSTVVATSSSMTTSKSSSPSSSPTTSTLSSLTTFNTSSFPTTSTSSLQSSTSATTSSSQSEESNTTAEPPFKSPTPTTDSPSKTTKPEEPPFTSPASTSTPTTDSSSKTTHPPQTNENISKSQDYTSVIAGSVVGGVILIVIVIIIFICRKRSQNRSSTTKPDTEKIDVNPDYISMDYQRIHRGHPDGGEIDDGLTKADNDVDLNEVIESDKSGQTSSKSNKDVVYAEVNIPGRKPLGSESNSVAGNFTLEDVYSVVTKAKNKRNYLEADDKSPERIITENELYVPFDDEASDRIVMENDLYVPMEDTLLTTVPYRK